MRPEDRDILFPDGRGRKSERIVEDADVDALMDAYFDGDISDDDRDLLFEALRRDLHRCRAFVEMQRATLLLQRAPMGPDMTDDILSRIGRRSRWRAGAVLGRLAIAAAVLGAGAGVVIVGQYRPLGGKAPVQVAHQSGEQRAQPGQVQQDQFPAPRMADATAAPSAALAPGRLHATETGQFSGEHVRIGGELPGLADGAASYPGNVIIASSRPQGPLEMAPLLIDPEAVIGAGMRELEGYSATSTEIGRRMGFALGGNAPWGVIGMLQSAEAGPVSIPAPAQRPATPAKASEHER
ncbi:MAG: hypothetical protein ACF8R7_17625 [Phycisphaerales bacterium JB039]